MFISNERNFYEQSKASLWALTRQFWASTKNSFPLLSTSQPLPPPFCPFWNCKSRCLSDKRIIYEWLGAFLWGLTSQLWVLRRFTLVQLFASTSSSFTLWSNHKSFTHSPKSSLWAFINHFQAIKWLQISFLSDLMSTHNAVLTAQWLMF